jgi:hypothetical protein
LHSERLAKRTFAKLNIYTNPAQISAFERIDFSAQNDYHFYAGNAAAAGC